MSHVRLHLNLFSTFSTAPTPLLLLILKTQGIVFVLHIILGLFLRREADEVRRDADGRRWPDEQR